MNILIDRIMELSGPMAQPAKHRRWLETLHGRALDERLKALQADAAKPRTGAMRLNFRARHIPSTQLEAKQIS